MKKHTIIFACIFLIACSNENNSSPILIGSQFSSCDHLINLDDEKVKNLNTPTDFKISPLAALQKIKEKTDFKCHHKFGAKIYADDKYYYFVRIGTGRSLDVSKSLTQGLILVSGINGAYWEMKQGL